MLYVRGVSHSIILDIHNALFDTNYNEEKIAFTILLENVISELFSSKKYNNNDDINDEKIDAEKSSPTSFWSSWYGGSDNNINSSSSGKQLLSSHKNTDGYNNNKNKEDAKSIPSDLFDFLIKEIIYFLNK